MLTSDVIMENPFVNSAIIDLSNSQIVIFTSQRSKEHYNVTQCNYKGLLSLFVNKAVGL